MPDWWEWRNNNWGTKWELAAVDCRFSRGPEALAYDFSTAWGPPDGVILKASEAWPELTFTLTYSEPGMDFSGRITFVDGNVESVEEGNYELFGEPFEYDLDE